MSSYIVTSNKHKPRCPRMNILSSRYNVNVFSKRCSFLEQMEEEELDNLKSMIRAMKVIE